MSNDSFSFPSVFPLILYVVTRSSVLIYCYVLPQLPPSMIQSVSSITQMVKTKITVANDTNEQHILSDPRNVASGDSMSDVFTRMAEQLVFFLNSPESANPNYKEKIIRPTS